MTNEVSQNRVSPVPMSSFVVKWNDEEFHFSEISGFETATQIMEDRHKNSSSFSPKKMLGIQKCTNITMKRGTSNTNKKYWEMYGEVKMNTHKRSTVRISLLDEHQSVVMCWKLINAFLVKISSPDLKSNSNDIAIETMEFAHEGICIG